MGVGTIIEMANKKIENLSPDRKFLYDHVKEQKARIDHGSDVGDALKCE